jgi:hypothetical protein
MRERKHLEGPAGRITWHARTFFAGNREISHLTSRCIRLVRIGQAKSSSRREKSDSAILAVKVPTYGEDFLGLSYRFRPESRTHVRAVTPQAVPWVRRVPPHRRAASHILAASRRRLHRPKTPFSEQASR